MAKCKEWRIFKQNPTSRRRFQLCDAGGLLVNFGFKATDNAVI
jgi:hypothetical protein